MTRPARPREAQEARDGGGHGRGGTTRPLFHRDKELDLITDAMDATHHGSGGGSVVIVTGGLGTGKTALLRALPERAERRGIRVVTASGAVFERDFGFGVLDQLLTPVLPGTAIALPGDTTGPSAGSEQDAALLALLAERSAHTPLLMLVDDLQWADVPSLRWLARLAGRVAELRVTLVVTLREGDPGEDGPQLHQLTQQASRVLRLLPLPPEGTADLVGALTGRPVDPACARACHEVTGGHPLLLAALVEELAGAGEGALDDVRAVHAARPVALHERFAVVLRDQPMPVREFAAALAVLGDGADEEMTGRLAGLDDTGRTEAVRVLRRLGLLAEGPVPRFVHPVVADAVEEAMTPAEAESIRVHAALLLHLGGHPAERAAAQLLAASATCHEDWQLDVLRAAAGAARRRSAPDTAARYLRRALLGSPPEGQDRAELLVELATVERDFAPRVALRHFAQALILFPDADQRARVAGLIPPFLLDGCPPATLDTVVRTAAELDGAAEPAGAARRYARRLEARLRHVAPAGPFEPAGSGPRLRSLGPRPCLDTAADRELVTVLLHGAAMAQTVTAAEAVPLAERLLQHEPAAADHAHTALPLLTDVLVASDSLGTIGPWLHTAHDRARRENADVPRAVIAVELTRLALARGDLTGARAYAAEALALDVTDWATLQTLAAVVLTALEARDAALCERLLSGTREEAVPGHRPSPRRLLHGAAAALRGDLPAALDCVLDWGRTAEHAHWRNPGMAPWRSWAAALEYRTGRLDRAHDLMDEEYARALSWGSPVPVGRAQRGKGALTEGAGGIRLLRESADTLEGTANALERARTALLLGRRLLARGEATEAERRLTRAREEGLACGAPWLAERAGLALHGIAGSPRADVVAALTRTERRVAGLAARGASNKAIAERLEVSSRAVEKHLTHAYRKLRIDGRTGLAAMSRLLSDDTGPVRP
ncbi:LuxR family transcriptional regulator [Streptomyces sp. NBC_00249]|uniref:LuxR family transcriptional regulator n=1 Tax=Streptomyces sp. NBC_00249 TaxID=2975690 RepID=UPI00225B1590|nr:LuxR family transcriptional regulator [Streptomyces sp. NBC_00249]MCX5195599.1 LuxR family transcriptional regulator [Streptomyces sp. NBC_00249]